MLTQLTLLATISLIPAAIAPQDAQQGRQGDPVNAVEYFTPERAPAGELNSVFQRLFSTGGPGTTFGQSELPPTLMTYGKSIVVRYRDDKIDQVMQLLGELDAQWSGEDGARSDSDLKTLEYRARHVTLETLADAISPFSHLLTISDGTSRYQVSNVSFLEERGLVVVRGPQAEIEQIEAVMKRVDVPQQQVLVTCYLIKGTEVASSEKRLPKELTDNLVKLVPFEGFESLAIGMLRSDALSNMSMSVDYAQYEKFSLELRPRAFDPQTRGLTLDRCEFGLSRGTGAGHSNQLFTTSATIRAGEYTVLGAVGAEPIFVVLHLTLVDA